MTELGIGVLAVGCAAAVLLLAVMRELAPAGGLTGRGRWLLAAGLGAGVLAFALKLVLIGLALQAPAAWFRHELSAQVASRQETQTASPAVAPGHYRWRSLPRSAPAPADNPTTIDKVALGKRLFFDNGLSLDRSVSCASCHDPFAAAGADGRAVSLGIAGQQGVRNAPTVWNAAFQARLFWDGRAGSLEEQALGPLVNPREMGMPSLEAVVRRVEEQPTYRAEFAQAFGYDSAITIEQITAAIAAYERTLITPDSPYDRFVNGDPGALTAQQVRGMALFESLGCVHCHAGPNFSAASIFDSAAPYRAFPALAVAELARLRLTEDGGRAAPGSVQGVWRIPSLRNVALTAPYFHNGSVWRLDEAVKIMARAQLGATIGSAQQATANVALAPNDDGSLELRPGKAALMTDDDVQAIVAFLEALSGDELSIRASRTR